jgi:hypothetical protein
MVVFGRTQVGKTTLILKLLGLPAQAVRAVSTVLRGTERRAIHPRQFPPNIGAVAMIAGASSAVGRMGNIQADGEARSALKHVRDKMEKGGASSDLHLCVIDSRSLFRGGASLRSGSAFSTCLARMLTVWLSVASSRAWRKDWCPMPI